MTSGRRPQTEADNVWPPTIEHLAGPAPAVTPDTKHRELQRGHFALLSALTGIGVPVFVVSLLMRLPRTASSATLRVEDALPGVWLTACFFGAACGVIAVVMGTMARGTRTGRWGLAIPLSVLAVFIVLILAQHSLNGTWPWQGYSDNCGCDGSG